MKRITSLFIVIYALFILSIPADIVPLTILTTNDLHAHLLPGEKDIGGAARIAAYNKKIRSQEKNVLILNAGDMVMGTPVSSIFKGVPIFHVLNYWGIDAAAIGNHEFDYGWQKIEEFKQVANFPLLCANAFVMGTNGTMNRIGDLDFKVFNYGKLHIGVIGVVTELTPEMATKFAVKDVHFTKSSDALNRLVPELSKKCDVLIALTHIGLEYDRAIAQTIEGIDLIVGGHDHIRLEKAIVEKGVPIVQSGSNGKFIGRIDLKADTEMDQITDFAYRLIPVDNQLIEPDPETEQTIREWEKKVSDIVDRPLGTAETDLSPRDMLDIAEAAFIEATGADYAHQNSGGTRGGIAKGEFTYRTIWNIFPFENQLVTATCKGKDLPDGFYGLQPAEPEKTYTLVTNSFIRDQWERYRPEHSNVKWQEINMTLRDSVIRYIEKRKKIGQVKLTR